MLPPAHGAKRLKNIYKIKINLILTIFSHGSLACLLRIVMLTADTY